MVEARGAKQSESEKQRGLKPDGVRNAGSRNKSRRRGTVDEERGAKAKRKQRGYEGSKEDGTKRNEGGGGEAGKA